MEDFKINSPEVYNAVTAAYKANQEAKEGLEQMVKEYKNRIDRVTAIALYSAIDTVDPLKKYRGSFYRDKNYKDGRPVLFLGLMRDMAGHASSEETGVVYPRYEIFDGKDSYMHALNSFRDVEWMEYVPTDFKMENEKLYTEKLAEYGFPL